MSTAHAVHYSSARTKTGRDDWQTPLPLFATLDAEFGFTLDCAASTENALCPAWLGPGSAIATDALSVSWSGSCWLNPPYSMLRAFVRHARQQALGGALVVALIPARTDTRAWHDDVMQAAEIRFLRGRVRFSGAHAGAPFPSAVVVWRQTDAPLRVVSWGIPR